MKYSHEFDTQYGHLRHHVACRHSSAEMAHRCRSKVLHSRHLEAPSAQGCPWETKRPPEEAFFALLPVRGLKISRLVAGEQQRRQRVGKRPACFSWRSNSLVRPWPVVSIALESELQSEIILGEFLANGRVHMHVRAKRSFCYECMHQNRGSNMCPAVHCSSVLSATSPPPHASALLFGLAPPNPKHETPPSPAASRRPQNFQLHVR